MHGVILDLRYAIRSIAGSKRFAAIVIATLALGIGAITAVFGVLNAVVLKPLPYDEPNVSFASIKSIHSTSARHVSPAAIGRELVSVPELITSPAASGSASG